MHEFIYAVGVVMMIGVLWVGYELYRIRCEIIFQRLIGKADAQLYVKKHPELFDQEQT